MKKKYSIKKDSNIWGYIFISPIIVGLGVFAIYPIFRSFSLSFYDWFSFYEPEFNGIENYKRLFFEDKEAYISIWNTFRITIFILPLSIALSLFLAMVLNDPKLKALGFFRLIYYLPVITMPAAIAIVWGYIFNGSYGILNEFLTKLNIPAVPWISDPKFSWISITIIGIWSAIGMQIVIILAALQGVDETYYEAADLEGANIFQKFFKISLPSISPTIFFLVVTGFVANFQLFDIVQIMMSKSRGLESTKTIVYYFYNTTFVQGDKGYGAALAVLIFVIIMIFTAIQLFLEKYWVYHDR